ncbi:MAG: acetolactate synthase [Clostridia bacterium]
MKIKQLSIFIENKEGRLAEITKILSSNDINIRALSLADTTNFGILRLIVSKPEKALTVLKDAGFTVSITEVLALLLDDKVGALSKALILLTENGVQVEYVYAFIGGDAKKAYVVLRVENNEDAIKLLKESNYELLSQSEIENI